MKWFDDISIIDKYLVIMYIIFSLLLALSFTSCLGSKTVSEKSKITKETEKVEVKVDSSSIEKINSKIDDEISTTVQPTGDPILDAKIDAILSKVNTTKTSGDNSYKFYYDEKLRQLRAEFAIGETKDSEVIVEKEEKIEKTFDEKQDEYFKKKVTTMPWYLWLALFVFLWPTIWKFIKPIIQVATGPANIVTGVSNFIKNKNDNKN